MGLTSFGGGSGARGRLGAAGAAAVGDDALAVDVGLVAKGLGTPLIVVDAPPV